MIQLPTVSFASMFIHYRCGVLEFSSSSSSYFLKPLQPLLSLPLLPSSPSPFVAMPHSVLRSRAVGSSNGKTTSASPKVSKICRSQSTWLSSRMPSPARKPPSPVPKPSSPEGKLSSSVSKAPSPVRKQFPSVAKLHSSIQNAPKLLESKPSIKPGITPEKPQSTPKESELQSKLDATEEYLSKMKKILASMEEENNKAIEELNEAKRCINETKEKLQSAIIDKHKAEDSLETEKFRTDELEQASIAAEEEFLKELNSIRKQHCLDASALLSVTEELQKVKLELNNSIHEKNNALREAEEAKKIAGLNAEKVNALSIEVGRLKSLFDSNLDKHKEAVDTIKKLEVENNALELELKRAKLLEEKLPKMEALAEQLQMEVANMKRVESDASKQVDELKKELASLEARLKEANESEKSGVETLAFLRKKMEEETSSLRDAETEIAALKRKISSTEDERIKCKTDLEEAVKALNFARQEAMCLEQTLEILRAELQKLEEEKVLLDGKVASADADGYSEEKNRLVNELEVSRGDDEKARQAIECLVSAIHEISSISRENERRLLAKQAEIEDAQITIERLNSELRHTKDMCELMLDEARYEIVCLKKTVERLKAELWDSNSECDAKELYFEKDVKGTEDEFARLKVEMANSLKVADKAAQELKADRAKIISKLRQAYEAAEEAKTESLQLKKRMLDKAKELQGITQDEQPWTRQASRRCFSKHQNCHKNDQRLKELEEENQTTNEDREWSMHATSTDLVAEKDQEDESTDYVIGPKINVDNYEWIFSLTEKQQPKKRTDFRKVLRKFLKKRGACILGINRIGSET